jgi:hypothetical protein
LPGSPRVPPAADRACDRIAAHLRRAILDPPPPVALVVHEIRARESSSIADILDVLSE